MLVCYIDPIFPRVSPVLYLKPIHVVICTFSLLLLTAALLTLLVHFPCDRNVGASSPSVLKLMLY